MSRSVSDEVRWIVLSQDGRHVTLGRHSDPSPDELKRAEDALIAAGEHGWLAVLRGAYYSQAVPSLLMVKTMGIPNEPWDKAVEAFERRRLEAVT